MKITFFALSSYFDILSVFVLRTIYKIRTRLIHRYVLYSVKYGKTFTFIERNIEVIRIKVKRKFSFLSSLYQSKTG